MMRRFGFSWVCALAGFFSTLSTLQSAEPVLRDPWLQPFDETSIWNTPIGEQSELVQVDLKSAYEVEPEIEYVYQISNNPFKRNVFVLSTWERRMKGDNKLDEIPIDDFILGAKHSEVNRRTACSALLMPDHQTVKNFCQFCRTSRSSPCFAAQETQWNLFEQDGMDDGRLTSGMSILGGSLRIDAYNRITNIHHPVKILLPASELSIGSEETGFRWPASRTAANYKGIFKGTNPELTIGALLTINSERMAELEKTLTSDFGKSFAKTCYRYGAYVVDYSRGFNIGLCMTPEFERTLNLTDAQPRNSTFPEAITKDLQAIFTSVKVVRDNGPEAKGGAGTRRHVEKLSPHASRAQFGRDDAAIISLRNGQMTDGELFPAYWNVIPGSRELVDFAFDDQFYYSTPRAFRFTSQLDRQIGFYQTLSESRSPLRFSVRVSAVGNVKLTLAMLSFNGNQAIADKLETIEIQGDAPAEEREWRLLEAVAKLPENGENYRIMLMSSGEGTVWFDDFDASLATEETNP